MLLTPDGVEARVRSSRQRGHLKAGIHNPPVERVRARVDCCRPRPFVDILPVGGAAGNVRLGLHSRRSPCLIAPSEAEVGIEPSVGSVGDSYDNALAETINSLYKAEVIHRRGPWRSFEAVEFATLEWVDWFNHRRLLEPIGNIPPAEAEELYYAMLDGVSMPA